MICQNIKSNTHLTPKHENFVSMMLGIKVSSSIKSIKEFNEIIIRLMNCLLRYTKHLCLINLTLTFWIKAEIKNGDLILYKNTFYLISLQD